MGVEEEITAQLLALGLIDADQEKKILKVVNAATITTLCHLWTQFVKGLDSKEEVISINRLARLLLQYTAFAVLDARYKNIDADGRKALSQALQAVALSPTFKDSPSLVKFFTGLGPVLENPWGYGAIRALLGGNGEDVKKVKSVDIDRVWATEGQVFLDARLEFLGQRPLKVMKKEFFSRILYVLLVKGKEVGENEELLEFDPYHLKEEQILEYWQAYVLLWQTGDELFDLEIFDRLHPSITLKLLDGLKTQNTLAGKRLIPKIFESGQMDLFSITSKLLVQSLFQDWSPEDIAKMISLWFNTFKETRQEPEWSEQLGIVIPPLFENRKRIKKSEYIYDLAKSVLENFVETEQISEYYLDVFIRAMNMDVDRMSTLKTEGLNQELKEARLQLSYKFMNLSDYPMLRKFPQLSRELILTAFSLNPCWSKFNILFPENYSSRPSDLEENLGLPEYLTDILHEITQKPRWGALRDIARGVDQKAHCLKLLEGSDFLVHPQELKFVDPEKVKKAQQEQQLKRRMLQMKASRSRNTAGMFQQSMKKPAIPALKRHYNKFQHHKTATQKINFKSAAFFDHFNKMAKFPNQSKQNFANHHAPAALPMPLPTLSQVKQWQNYSKTLAKASKAQETEAKAFYTKKFLSTRKPVPEGYPWIPYPRVATGNDQDSKLLRTHGQKRKNPTRYVPHKSAGLNRESFEFPDDGKMDLKALRAAFRGEVSASKDFQIPEIEDSLWERVHGLEEIDDSYEKMMLDIQKRKPFVNGCCKILKNLQTFQELTELSSTFHKERESAMTNYLKLKEEKKDELLEDLNPIAKPDKVIRRMVKFVDKADSENVDPQALPEGYLLGILWDKKKRKQRITMPPAPKSRRELFRNTTVVEGALHRIKLSLEKKSYASYELIEQEIKSMKAAEAKLASLQILPPPPQAIANPVSVPAISPISSNHSSSFSTSKRTKVRMEKVLKRKRKSSGSFEDSMEETPKSKKRNSIITPKTKGRKNKTWSENDIDIKDEEFIAARLGLDLLLYNAAITLMTNDLKNGIEKPTSQNENHSCSFCDEGGSSKRKWTPYPDSLIYQAIIAMKAGKTMKQAAEMYGIERSALCKRLHLWNLRKDGKLVLRPEIEKILEQENKKVPNYSKFVGVRGSSTKTDYTNDDLNEAIHSKLLDGRGTRKVTKVPESTVVRHVERWRKLDKNATTEIRNSLSELECEIESSNSSSSTNEVEEKVTMKISMPVLNNPSFRRAAETISGKPLSIPEAPVLIEKPVENPTENSTVDEEQILVEKSPKQKDEEIDAETEERLLNSNPSSPLPNVTVREIEDDGNGRKTIVVQDPSPKPQIIYLGPEMRTCFIKLERVDGKKFQSPAEQASPSPSPSPSISGSVHCQDHESEHSINERKSLRLHSKTTKLDFKNGTPIKTMKIVESDSDVSTKTVIAPGSNTKRKSGGSTVSNKSSSKKDTIDTEIPIPVARVNSVARKRTIRRIATSSFQTVAAKVLTEKKLKKLNRPKRSKYSDENKVNISNDDSDGDDEESLEETDDEKDLDYDPSKDIEEGIEAENLAECGTGTLKAKTVPETGKFAENLMAVKDKYPGLIITQHLPSKSKPEVEEDPLQEVPLEVPLMKYHLKEDPLKENPNPEVVTLSDSSDEGYLPENGIEPTEMKCDSLGYLGGPLLYHEPQQSESITEEIQEEMPIGNQQENAMGEIQENILIDLASPDTRGTESVEVSPVSRFHSREGLPIDREENPQSMPENVETNAESSVKPQIEKVCYVVSIEDELDADMGDFPQFPVPKTLPKTEPIQAVSDDEEVFENSQMSQQISTLDSANLGGGNSEDISPESEPITHQPDDNCDDAGDEENDNSEIEGNSQQSQGEDSFDDEEEEFSSPEYEAINSPIAESEPLQQDPSNDSSFVGVAIQLMYYDVNAPETVAAVNSPETLHEVEVQENNDGVEQSEIVSVEEKQANAESEDTENNMEIDEPETFAEGYEQEIYAEVDETITLDTPESVDSGPPQLEEEQSNGGSVPSPPSKSERSPSRSPPLLEKISDLPKRRNSKNKNPPRLSPAME